MSEFTCPGLPASWVNAWLAAVGATVLDSRIRLHWSEQGKPVAVLSSTDIDPVKALAESWPDSAFLGDLPIAENWNEAGVMKRKVSVEQFVERARKARGHPFDWALSSTMTDLSVEENGTVSHAPFDPPAPKGIFLHHRLLQVHEKTGSICETRLCSSLEGKAKRVQSNGLGFDCTRLGSLADQSDVMVEPVVEFLAFFGLALFPLRARGVDQQAGSHSHTKPGLRQRGWQKKPNSKKNERLFVWPVWRQPLDKFGIDALLDAWHPWRKTTWPSLGIHAAWKSTKYQPKTRSAPDATRAFGSEML